MSLSGGLGVESGSESADQQSGFVVYFSIFISTYLESFETSSKLSFSVNSEFGFFVCKKSLTRDNVSETAKRKISINFQNIFVFEFLS